MVNAVRADYIIESSDRVHKDSVLISKNGIIKNILPYREFNPNYVDSYTEKNNAILTPGFINCHTHLELSSIPKIKSERFTDWILELVKTRTKQSYEEQYNAAIKVIKETIKQGTIAFGDITNTGMLIDYLNENNVPNYSFIEVLGFQENKCEKIFSDLDHKFSELLGKYSNVSLSPHAPYSMSRSLLKRLKSDRLQSFHIDEPLSEREFLLDGTGEFYEFLNKIGSWDEKWKAPKLNPYSYVQEYGYLENTLLVHSLNIKEEEIELVKSSTVVLCPRSNEYLHNKSPNIKLFLDNNINCILGTDSLASCDDLSILNEMKHIYKTQLIDPKVLFKMATVNGAEALCLNDYGTLSIGKKYHINEFQLVKNCDNIFESIII